MDLLIVRSIIGHGECIHYYTPCDIPASTYCVNCKCFDVHKKNNSIDYEQRKQDGAWMTGKRAYSKAYYIQHHKRMKTQARIAYKINRKNKLATALSKLVHALNPKLIKAKCRTLYNKNKASKQIKSRQYSKLKYVHNPETKKKRARENGCDL